MIVKRSSESPAAALGYLYQVRSALLWSLRRLKTDSEFLVGIETLDDVAFETTGGDPIEILQTKHHKAGTGYLTDMSLDLWKTLRNWFDGRQSGENDSQSSLFLVTTAYAPSKSAAWYLRTSSRNISAAQIALTAAAEKSTNSANAKAYHAFLAIDPSVREEILEKITVFDAAPCVTDLESELKQEVYWAAGRENHAAFLQRLEGWWYRRVLHQLSNAPTDRIGAIELEGQMSDLREQFKQQALPIDDDLLDFSLDDATRDAHKGSTFVQQIELTKAGNRRIASAIRDYYRAFEQRSRWLRDGLIVGGMNDLHKYEKRLVEEWELTFESMRDELGDSATADAKEAAARKVLEWAEKTVIPIRPNVTEPFISRGSLHMLSDELRIGWHIDFRDRLAHLLTTET
ncbi:MAG: hypothetical protein ISN26_00055 [Betaproteobacteria bacterium AqS2]|uniref:ABC-three component systems C-terminal domain-containing protein n=1 Tax=Candidatus Amphirhobacter heronislandensis TaxID=1732024 RepID=A0A930Y232_9GAMM|nr:hypothetical protein [Betaproteobacteria bacterium AqS2]